MSGSRSERWSPLAGIAFVVLFVAGLFLDNIPSADDSAAKLISYYNDRGEAGAQAGDEPEEEKRSQPEQIAGDDHLRAVAAVVVVRDELGGRVVRRRDVVQEEPGNEQHHERDACQRAPALRARAGHECLLVSDRTPGTKPAGVDGPGRAIAWKLRPRSARPP